MVKLLELGHFITQAVHTADLWDNKWWQEGAGPEDKSVVFHALSLSLDGP